MPTALKVITGNRSKRPLPANEPDLSSPCPDPPAILHGESLAEWHRHAKTLHAAGILTESDAPAFAMYCTLYGRWIDAERTLAAHRAEKIAEGDPDGGFLTSTPNGANMQHPLVGVANTAARDAMKYAAEFGLTPSARTRVGNAPSRAPQDPSAKYF